MSSYLETAAEIAREAGALVANFYERRIPFELKGDYDLVTEADRASERLIVDRLSSHFPSHGIVAEEGGGHESASEFRWFVDPLDGTTNFAHGFPMFNVTLGLARGETVIAGVVYDPIRNEMFMAERGGGAYLNHKRIHTSKAKSVAESLMATGFPSQKRHLNVNIHFYYQMAMLSHGVRRAGAAALDLAYTACGRLDGFWEFGLKPWDMAAGTLLVEEAGGRCTGMKGETLGLPGVYLLATNGAIHDGVLSLFADVFAGKVQFPLPKI